MHLVKLLFNILFLFQCATNSIEEKNDSPPMVAFMCGKPAMHFTEQGWIRDDSVTCLHEPVEILNYCRSVRIQLTES